MNATFETLTSANGTPIAVERKGGSPPVTLIGGAFNDRSTVAGLAAVLAPDFTAVTYNRRGRGDSGDSGDYAVEREIENPAAVIAHTGGAGGRVWALLGRGLGPGSGRAGPGHRQAGRLRADPCYRGHPATAR